MLQRRRSLAVREVDIGARTYEGAHDPCVTVVAAAEDDRLQQSGPAEPVDVVDLDLGLEQALDDPDIAAVGGTDQASAVVVASTTTRTGIARFT